MKRRSLAVLTLVFSGGLAFAGCAFTNSSGQQIIFNPKSADSVACFSGGGCTGPDGLQYNNGDKIPVTCDPNYSPCVPTSSDVDCADGGGDGPVYVIGPVNVIGTDIYGLDANHDGVGCER